MQDVLIALSDNHDNIIAHGFIVFIYFLLSFWRIKVEYKKQLYIAIAILHTPHARDRRTDGRTDGWTDRQLCDYKKRNFH